MTKRSAIKYFKTSPEIIHQRRWHLEECFVKINGERPYLWRSVDHEGEVLENYVTKTRDQKAALKAVCNAH